MNDKHLLMENNVVSLRTAFVTGIESFVRFSLSPADLAAKIPEGRKWFRPQDFDWASEDSAVLYRQAIPALDELKTGSRFPSLEPLVRKMSFERPPEFKLVWTDSGHSVALYLNGQPWAFIDETSHCGFSKGMLEGLRNKRPWDQKLFEKIFSAPKKRD